MILVTGATGFLGKAVIRKLAAGNTPYVATSLSLGLDLRDRAAVEKYFSEIKPNAVIHCAAFVGGIQFGIKNAVQVFEHNMQMTLNVFHGSQSTGVKRVMHPVSNCVYPGDATLFKEDEIWNGALHESVEAYGTARKSLYIASKAYRRQYGLDTLNLVLSNMYGPDDHFEAERSHALGALVKKIIDARDSGGKEVVVWGSGAPVREWLYVDDAAEALIRGLEVPAQNEVLNIGLSQGISIKDLAHLICDLAGFKGELVFDRSKADGALHKTVDGTRAEKLYKWQPSTSLRDGIAKTIAWYEGNKTCR